MNAATVPSQRPPGAKLLVLDPEGGIRHWARAGILHLLRAGDLVVANDAATLPASLHGIHVATGGAIEVRLAQRASLESEDVRDWIAVVFGEGDYHTRTERRPAPPRLAAGDALQLGPLHAVVLRLDDHPRLVALRFDGTPATIWPALARHGRPIQYAHMQPALALWNVWTPFAGAPVALEPPSAGFALDWRLVADMRARGVAFATLTHAAGISSTGDAALDARLPFDEPYSIPAATVEAIARARSREGRVIAVGTTVVRALESAADEAGRVWPGPGVARQRLGRDSRLRVVDAILSGTHEPGTSHYELLQAFADPAALRRADAQLEARGYLTHEFGDSVLVERARRPQHLALHHSARQSPE